MAKINIHTKDIFDIKDVKIRWKYFDFCRKEALKCGLICECIMDRPFMKLELWGSKCQFIKYYFKTLMKCKNKVNGIKRIFSIISTK